jgi:hypothetical protein
MICSLIISNPPLQTSPAINPKLNLHLPEAIFFTNHQTQMIFCIDSDKFLQLEHHKAREHVMTIVCD